MIQKADYSLERLDTGFATTVIDDLSKPEDSLLRMGDPEATTSGTDPGENYVAWKVHRNGKTIGYMWIDLQGSNDLQAPSLHFAVNGDENMAYLLAKDAIRHAYCNLPYTTLYSRHLVANESAPAFDKKLGFEKDGDAYDDEHGRKWQNVALVL